MKKIAIFQRDFQVGGIQSSLLNILSQLDYTRYCVDVYYFDDKPFYELPCHEGLNFILCRPFPFVSRFVSFKLLLGLSGSVSAHREYDVAVDFNSYSAECAVAALKAKAKKRIMWIHNDMKIKYSQESKYRVLWHFFKSKFQYFDEFCAVSPGVIDGFREMTGLDNVKITTVQNYLDTSAVFAKAKEAIDFSVDGEEYNLCTMGRLCHQKGFDILLDYMAEIVQKRKDIHLYIIGDGPERTALEEQIEKLALTEYVSMLGSKSNPFPYLDMMDGFALTSRYEGQGIVLWEAKALGLELFMTKNLEQYNPGLSGREDFVEAVCAAGKKEKVYDDLSDYNKGVSSSLYSVLESVKGEDDGAL